MELVVSLWINSLVMFSDGLHNLSDGLALVVAFYAERKKLEVRPADAVPSLTMLFVVARYLAVEVSFVLVTLVCIRRQQATCRWIRG